MIAIYLPQINLFDNAAHCKNGSDLRFNGNSTWFKCFDYGFIIPSEQVCDNDIYCYDRSDERSCDGEKRRDSFLSEYKLIDGDFMLSLRFGSLI